MIRFTRTATIANTSVIPQVLGWATEFNSYINDNYDTELHFGLELFGSARMFWYIDADDVQALQNLNAEILQDTKYWEIVGQASDFWVDGSLQDEVVQLMG